MMFKSKYSLSLLCSEVVVLGNHWIMVINSPMTPCGARVWGLVGEVDHWECGLGGCILIPGSSLLSLSASWPSWGEHLSSAMPSHHAFSTLESDNHELNRMGGKCLSSFELWVSHILSQGQESA